MVCYVQSDGVSVQRVIYSSEGQFGDYDYIQGVFLRS